MSKMKLKNLMSTTMIAFGGLVLTAPAAAAAQQQQPAATEAPKLKISEGASQAIMDLQKAVNANDVASIPAKLAAAQAKAKSKDDKYFIGQLQLKAALAAKDNAATAAAVDAIAASGFLDNAKVAELYTGLGVTFYNAKNYPQALTYFNRAASLNPSSVAPLKLVAETQLQQGQKAEAAATLMKAIQMTSAGGLPAEEDLYKRALGLAYEANSPTAVDIGRQWIAAYPSATSWRNAIAVYRNYTQPDVESTLDLLRLMQAAGALTTAGDYRLFISAAAEQLNYNEAQAVVDAGIAAKVIDPAGAEFRDILIPLKAKPKATAADLAQATKTAQSGMALLRIGDRYYGMGNYAKAAELYRMSMGKAGVDPAIANLHLGMALARSGDKAGAAAALNAVTGQRADVAKYWLLYVNKG
jgi:tetratricopeptide (TPR) repeat protein